ncbi:MULTISPECIES: ABC transporter permease subunit [Arthrobacter]|uniref:ABC transporter permease subunit n=1 Tax=Arthrobacter TaxID=1663 RepID=UPI001D147AD8|nr:MULTISPECIES: ABC transporter permease subunit [Arthrobacter]MCC3281809.1 ABC transporter permease subunit [Arthrobacter caoxuetaonis]MCC9194748.1 ABC transporter permease subunit [Arthrobacter sp. zg-Y916]
MSTAAAPASRTPRAWSGGPVTFGRVLRSEWIKTNTVPSTVILLAVSFAVMVGLGTLVAWGIVQLASDPESGPPQGIGQSLQSAAYDVPAAGLPFGQLLIAALAVVVIGSEYTTGMIRSTMVAVPTRTPALLAKTLVIAVISFVLGVVAAFTTYLLAQPILAGSDLDFGLDAPWVLPSIINTGTVLALIAIMGVGIGALLRNTAGGVVTLVGALFVLPIIAGLLTGLADWVEDAARFLPSSAAAQLVATNIQPGQFNQVEGGLILAGWAVILLAAAAVVLKKRDV